MKKISCVSVLPSNLVLAALLFSSSTNILACFKEWANKKPNRWPTITEFESDPVISEIREKTIQLLDQIQEVMMMDSDEPVIRFSRIAAIEDLADRLAELSPKFKAMPILTV